MDWGEIKNHLRQGKGGNADPGLERPPHPAGGHPCQRRCASHRRQGLSGVRRNTPGNHDTRRVLIVLSLVAFRPFRPPKFPRSTKPAPPSLQLAAGTGQHRLFPAPGCVLPHPLQNRVPRSAGHLWRSAAPVSAPASVGAGRSPLGSSTPAGSRNPSLFATSKIVRYRFCGAWLFR